MASLTADEASSGFSYGGQATRALVIAEDAGRAAAAVAALDDSGCVALAPIGFAEAVRERGRFDGIELLWIEGAGAPDDLFDLAVMRAETLVGERHCALILSVVPAQIDAVALHLAERGVELLCDPTPYERAGAVALARRALAPAVNEITAEREAARLQRMHEEFARFSETLARLTREDDAAIAGVQAPGHGYRAQDADEAPIEAAEIRALIRSRRLRAQFFGEGLFEDPALDMLLDLFAAQLERRRVSVSSLCIAAAVAPTTALRWIGKMDRIGLLQRQADPHDRRRAYISLTPAASDALRGYIAAARRNNLPLA